MDSAPAASSATVSTARISELALVASSEASASSSSTGGVPESQTADILGNIQKLKGQQKALKDQRKKIASQLRNEEKRRNRIRKRARQLSDTDLVALLKMRADAPTAASASSAPTGTSEPSE